MVPCICWATTTKPIAAIWTGLSGSCENGLDWRDEFKLALCAERRAYSLYPAYFFLPDVDLPRTWPHDYGPRPPTSGNLRSGDRAEAEDKTPQRRANIPNPRALLAGVPGAGDDARSGVLRPGHLGVFR